MNYNNYECTICNQDMNPYYSKFQNHKIPNAINPLMLLLISQLRHIPPCHNYWLQLKEVGSYVVEVLGFLGEWRFRPTTHIPIDSKGKFHHEFKNQMWLFPIVLFVSISKAINDDDDDI